MNRQFTLYINENMFNSHDKRNTNLNYLRHHFSPSRLAKILNMKTHFIVVAEGKEAFSSVAGGNTT